MTMKVGPYPSNFFDGRWESNSYGCTETQPTVINMSTDDKGVVAGFKMTDAECVQKGEATLRFDSKDSYQEPGNYPCEVIVGTAQNPQNSALGDCEIKIHDCNYYELKQKYFSLHFYRAEKFSDCNKAFQAEPESDDSKPSDGVSDSTPQGGEDSNDSDAQGGSEDAGNQTDDTQDPQADPAADPNPAANYCEE